MRALAPALSLLLLAGAGAARADDEPAAWSGFASAYAYRIPDSEDFVNPNVAVDHGRLHLEGRHNYEGIGTWSLWMGANFHAGTKWEFDATLMFGGVFGDIEGFAPAYRLSLARSWFYVASESEYFLDNHDHEGNFLYSWNEIAGAPTAWFRVGLAAQRTRAYETGLDIQRGPFVGFTYKQLDVAVYVFNLDDEPTGVVSVRIDF